MMPARLGPYEIQEVLGRGGGGIVYRALAADGRRVAVKTLTHESGHDLTSLRAEVHALRRIQHPGVVQIFDDGVDSGRPWFAMEWLEGETLASYAQRKLEARTELHAGGWTTRELHELIALLVTLCEPLAALHESGIVHRDLKLDNIVLREEGRPVLIDFGLATHRLTTDVRARPEPALADGTLGYMAPEQISGELVDARTDLYALGCIVFELLVGTPPSWCEEGALPSQLVAGIPPTLDALVASLLAPRARDRLGHADDAITWLQASLTEGAHVPRSFPPARRRWLYRPFLSGRQQVLAQLSAGLNRMQNTRGSFMVLEGESGIGKTHIAAEIARRAAHTARVLTASCPPADGAQPPLACWERLFEHAAEQAAGDPERPVAIVVARHLPLLAQLHGAFARLGPGGDPPLSPTAHEVFATIRELVSALAEKGPLLLVVDDLQWIDELSLGALRLLDQDFLAQRPVFLLATFRDDDRAGSLVDLLGEGLAERISPGPLPRADLHELVADMLGVAEPPSTVVDWVAAHAEGNPFLAAEYLRLVVTELPLARELSLGTMRVRSPSPAALGRLPTPRSVHELVHRRLDTLEPTALDVAELLAVLGGTINADAMQAFAEDTGARDSLLDLERQQLVEPAPGGGRKLVHDRIRVVLYDQLDPSSRTSLHRRAATLLSRCTEIPHAAVARHFELAGDPAASLPHLEHAGELALARGAHDAAARLFDAARSTGARLAVGGTRFSLERRVQWLLGSARAEYGRGQMGACEERVRDALALSGRSLPRGRLAWIALALREGVVGSAAAVGLGSSAATEVRGQLAIAAGLLPYRYFYAGDLLPVIGSSLLSANLARHGTHATAAGPISLLAFTAGLFRLPRLASRYFAEAAGGALAQREYREAAQVLSLESMSHGNFARWDEAERAALGAAEAGSHTSDPWLLETIETSLAHVEFFTGRFGPAHARAASITRMATSRHHAQHAIWGLYLQARSDLPRRRWREAAERLEDALARLSKQPEQISEIACHGMLAHALLELGRPLEAERHALWVVERVKGLAPPGYPSIVGYSSAAHALRALLEAAPSTDRRRAARSLAASLWRFASVFPVAVPAASLHTGHLARLQGHRRLAFTTFEAAARWAKVRAMRWEHVQLALGAARTATNEHVARELETEAHLVCAELGVPTP